MHTRTTSTMRLRALILLGAAILIPVAAGPPAAEGAPPAEAGGAAQSAAAVAPTVMSVPLSGLSSAVLEAAPEPSHVHAADVTAQSTPDLRPAVAASAALDEPAALVAVTAPSAFPTGTAVQVRVRESGRWSAWTELELDPDHGPDPDSEEARDATRVGTDPLTTADATSVQVRIDTPTGRVPAGTRLTAVHAPTSAADAQLPDPAPRVSAAGVAASAASMPSIITRRQWGADESLRNREPYYTGAIKAGFVHHTASTSNYTQSQAAAQVRAIYAYHTKSLGHSDIDYNFVVDRFGRLYEGRYGGMSRPVLGGHTAGFNENTFAVVALGNFESAKPSATNMAAIKESIARLFAWKLGLYGVNPGSTARLVSAGFIRATKYPKGSVALIPALSSHQTVNYTACPGTYLQAQIPAIRTLAAAYSRVALSAPTLPVSSFRQGTRSSVAISAHASTAMSWTAKVLSPCSDTPIRTFSGTRASAGRATFTWDLKDSAGEQVLPAAYTIEVAGRLPDGTAVPAVSSTLTITPGSGGAWGPCGNATRVSGSSAAVTSVLWGQSSRPSSRTVVLTGTATASATARAAGVVAAPLARSLRAPLLLTARASLSPSVSEDIRLRRATEVIIVGSTSVVSRATATQVAALGATVTRLSGSSTAATAAAVAQRMGGTSAVLVSPGDAPAHAHVGSALAAARGVPVLLVAPGSVPTATRRALKGRTSVTVVAPTSVSDATLRSALSGIPFTRIAAGNEVTASLAAAPAHPGTPTSVMLMPDEPASWSTVSVAAAAGVPLLFTSTSALADPTSAYLAGRPALRGAVTTASPGALADGVLGRAGQQLQGRAWVPTPVAARPTATRTASRTNASPEPIAAGRSLKVSATVKAAYTDGVSRAVPDGVPFTVQFKASGTTTYRTVARGTTASGRATASVPASSSGRWRIVVGTLRTTSDLVRVTR